MIIVEGDAARMRRRCSRSSPRLPNTRMCRSTTGCAVSSTPRCPRSSCSRPAARSVSRPRKRWSHPPRRRCCPILEKVLPKETDPEIQRLLEQTKAGIELKSADPARGSPRSKCWARATSSAPRPCCYLLLEKDANGQFAGARREGARAGRARHQPDRPPAGAERLRRTPVHRHQPRQHPAAGRPRAGDHLRAAGRDQHGARRDDHDRRLCHLRHAAAGQELCARMARLVSGDRGAGGIPRRGAGRDGARAQRDPLAVRPAAGNAARHLGHQPVPDPARAPDLRRAERRSGQPVLDVGRHRVRQSDAALQPHRHHRLRPGGAARSCG